MNSALIRTRSWVPALRHAAILTVFSASVASASPPVHVWSGVFGAQGLAVTVDGARNAYVTGYFTTIANFGGGDLMSAGGADVFLAKFDPAGNHIWSRRFGDHSPEFGRAIAVDDSANVYLAGDFYGSIELGGSVFTSAGFRDIFLAKYDSSGTHVWSRRFGGTEDDLPASMAVTASGEIYMTGSFLNTVNFGGGDLVSTGLNDIFLAKLDASGNHLWSDHYGDDAQQFGSSVSIDDLGNVFMAATFQDSVDFGPVTLVSSGSDDILVSQFDSAGTFQWGFSPGGMHAGSTILLAADGVGGVFAAGGFRDTVNFGGGNVVSAGSSDAFLVRFDTDGVHQWSQSFGGTSGDFFTAMVVDDFGELAMTASFFGSVDFGGGSMSSGDGGLLLASYDALGFHRWSLNLGGPGADAQAHGVTVDDNDQITMTGIFCGSVDFGGGYLGAQNGRDDIFVAAFGPSSALGIGNTPQTASLVLSAYPNPFRPSVDLQFTLPSMGPVSLEIFDVRGRRVRFIPARALSSGPSFLRWDGRDDDGRRVPSGVYYARLRQGKSAGTVRLVTMR